MCSLRASNSIKRVHTTNKAKLIVFLMLSCISGTMFKGELQISSPTTTLKNTVGDQWPQ